MSSPRAQKRRKFWRRTALILLGVLVGLPIAAHEQVRLTASGRIHSAQAAPEAPFAIVLGCAVRPNGEPSLVLQARLDAAATLWKVGRVRSLLVSGSGDQPHYDEPGTMRRVLRDLGVPDQAIIEDPRGLRTLDTMIRAREVYGITEALIVTQRWHLPRSLFLARTRGGIDCSGVAAEEPRSRSTWWTPRREIAARVVAWLDVYALGSGEGAWADWKARDH